MRKLTDAEKVNNNHYFLNKSIESNAHLYLSDIALIWRKEKNGFSILRWRPEAKRMEQILLEKFGITGKLKTGHKNATVVNIVVANYLLSSSLNVIVYDNPGLKTVMAKNWIGMKSGEDKMYEEIPELER
jgi:hypothetical protein